MECLMHHHYHHPLYQRGRSLNVTTVGVLANFQNSEAFVDEAVYVSVVGTAADCVESVRGTVSKVRNPLRGVAMCPWSCRF